MLEKAKKEEIKNITTKYEGRELISIVEEEKINLLYVNFAELDWNHVSGAIIYDGENKVFRIFIHEWDNENRKTFTLAHELWHYFLHSEYLKQNGIIADSDDNILYRWTMPLSDDRKILEEEANYFAAELLMPEETVRKAREREKNPADLAKIFGVSLLAMSYRLDNLNLLDSELD